MARQLSFSIICCDDLAANMSNHLSDRFVLTAEGFGGDISTQRVDDLDRRALTQIMAYTRSPVCIDLGCGLGAQGLRFALLGAETHLYDRIPASDPVIKLSQHYQLSLRYHQKDLMELRAEDLPENIDVVYTQRCIHYLRYPQAVGLMKTLRRCVGTHSTLFVSASGLNTEYYDGYEGKNMPLETRWGCVSEDMQHKHGVLAPLCLYTCEDLKRLMTEAGFKTDEVWSSKFGNVKGVFSV